MDLHDKEKSSNKDMPHRGYASHIDSILLKQSPPVKAPKPVCCQIPDFDSICVSVTSDASECDNVFLNNVQNGVARNYPFSDCNEIPSPLNFNSEPTLSVHSKIKNYVERNLESASGKFQQCTGTSFNPGVTSLNGTFPASKQHFSTPKLHQFTNNSSRLTLLDNNGELRPNPNMNPSFSSGHQNVCSANSNFENINSPCESQLVNNFLNKSDSAILLPKQLLFRENNTGMNDYFNASKQVIENNLKKIRKHHSLDGKEVASKHQLELQSVDSGISSINGVNRIDTSITEGVPNKIWTLVHEQNEKIKELQNQLSAIQQQKNNEYDSKQKNEVQLLENQKINDTLMHILQCLTNNNNKIDALTDKVNILAEKTAALEFKSNNNISEPLNVINSGKSSEAVTISDRSKDDVMCQTETHVKKTSSSTMTSINLDGNEKLLFHKTTIVTENCQQGLLFQCSQNESSPVNKTQQNKSQNHSGEIDSNCSKFTTPKCLDTKKKPKEAVKNNRICENVTSDNDIHSPAPTAVKLRASNHKHPSPLSESNKENKAREIRRNIKNLALREDVGIEPSEKHCCCHKVSNNSPCSDGTSAVKRKPRTSKNSKASVSSNTSEDSDYSCPKSGWTDIGAACAQDWYDSTEIKYGIPSALMSIDTQQYLEKHKLYDNSRKWSSKKSTAPHSKRQLR